MSVQQQPCLSVIMPVHQGAEVLPRSLAALVSSSLPRKTWELIVVDDASTDGSAAVASRWADRVLSMPSPAGGPGGARNRGAAEARAAWVLFVDADVVVHPATLRRVVDAVEGDPELVAVFGAYDEEPAAPGLVSQYRNLLHRYVHLRGAGEARTFWAGCGAVRRDAFLAVGGFDTSRFHRPQVEDIELGYRLGDRGGRLRLDPAITGTHLKVWTLGGMLRTDVLDRGIPWMRLILERRGRRSSALNTTPLEGLKVGLAGLGMALIPVAAVLPVAGLGAALAAVVLALLNLPFMRWAAGIRGVGFAVRVLPLHLLHYGSAAVAATLGLLRHVMETVIPGASAGARQPT